jgi:hypothetical protein
VTVVILLDARPVRAARQMAPWAGRGLVADGWDAPGLEPMVTGNFNAWGVPIPMSEMKDHHDVWQLVIGMLAAD